MAHARLRSGLPAILGVLLSSAAPIAADAAANAPWGSRITGMTVAGTQDVGTFKGVGYTRVYGTVSGIVDSREDVAGLAALKKNAQGLYEYTSEFEIIAPASGQPANEAMFIDAENRGNPSILNLLNEADADGPPSRSVYKPGVGNGFFQNHATSYARVQWQTKISKGVPENAQGIGLVIMRDFARMLSGYTAKVSSANGYTPATYEKLILGGKSQSSWMVIDFIAEGFNVEPITGNGVFQGAIAPDGIGHWMALNNLAKKHGEPQHPYIAPNAPPLQRAELLSRPKSDPIFIDTVAYTDFYRLRGSLTDFAVSTPKYRRYDVPGPHGVQKPPVRTEGFACNNGVAVPLNPISMSPFMRAQFIGLEKAIGVKAAQSGPSLPPSTVFKLAPAPKSNANFNPLPGYDVKVPAVDSNNMPIGGVRLPDADYPLGKPMPVSLAPVITTSIDNTCGNRGAFQPFSFAELNAKYGSKEHYLDLYRAGIRKLAGENFLLAEDEQPMLAYAGYLWDHAENYLVDRRSAEAR